MSMTTTDKLTASELRTIGILQPMRIQPDGELLKDWHNTMARVDADDRVAFDHEPETHWNLEQCLDAGWVFKAHPCIKFWQNCTRSKYCIEGELRSIGLRSAASGAVNVARVATMIEALRDAGKILASDWLAVTAYDRLKYVSREGDRKLMSPLGIEFDAPASRTVLSGEDSYSFRFSWFNAVCPKALDDGFSSEQNKVSDDKDYAAEKYPHGFYRSDYLRANKIQIAEERMVDPCDDLTHRTICKHDENHNEWVKVEYRFCGNGGIIQRWSDNIWNMEQWSEHHAYSVHT